MSISQEAKSSNSKLDELIKAINKQSELIAENNKLSSDILKEIQYTKEISVQSLDVAKNICWHKL